MSATPCAVIILAAGKGSRMMSSVPKPLHAIAGKKMIHSILEAIQSLDPCFIGVVIAPETQELYEKTLLPLFPSVTFIHQTVQLGTAHALMQALPRLKELGDIPVLVLCGDTPFISRETLQDLLTQHDKIHDEKGMALLGFIPENPKGYGRIFLDESGQNIRAIREEKDANEEEHCVSLCNSGIMVFSNHVLQEILPDIKSNNAASEYYLTDMVACMYEKNRPCVLSISKNAYEVMGINSREDLAKANYQKQTLLRKKAMQAGVTLIDPESTFFHETTCYAPDVIIHPHVVFGENVVLESFVEIRSFSHLEGVVVKENTRIGPFVNIRPNSIIGEACRVGSFVEMKNTTLGDAVTLAHLNYIGDATVGEYSNIGGGAITCNYDGEKKNHTNIGEACFIGSNVSIVAPITIGDRSVVGAGSVITKNIEPETLAISRSEQKNLKNKASLLRYRPKRHRN